MKKTVVLFFLSLLFFSCRHQAYEIVLIYDDTLPPVTEGYVGLSDGHFVLDGEVWFPIMLNYKAEMRREGDSIEVVPASYYRLGTIEEHFDTMSSWGFNAVRVCLDVLDSEMDSAAMFRATRRMMKKAGDAGLHVMLLIKPPFETYWQSYTKGLLRALADMPQLWAYDFINEPLYFDPVENRDKKDAVMLVSEWRHWVRCYAPHHLFTVATAEPIEVFEWDPSMLPVDFVEMHTYHPLRVISEMWWYSRYCGKPWIVGETGLPADNDSVPYQWQESFFYETYRYANIFGAVGYGWWEFGDCPEGVNFEAQYTGLRDTSGVAKPAARILNKSLFCFSVSLPDDFVPVNYYNMLAYSNIKLTGRVVDEKGDAVEGAVVRGWNQDWSVGMNTFTDKDGNYTLYSNDYNVHFEISAPGMSHKKFDLRDLHYINARHPRQKSPVVLPDRHREYQQIDYRPYLPLDEQETPFSLDFDSSHFSRYTLVGDMGTTKLRKRCIECRKKKIKTEK